jgi:hypothetical protein
LYTDGWGSKFCGAGYEDHKYYAAIELEHSEDEIFIEFNSGLDETNGNEAWGIRDFLITYDRPANGCPPPPAPLKVCDVVH